MEPHTTTTPRHSHYPGWHYQPLRLLNAEIANPLQVIAEFFSACNLPQARKHLKEMLEDAMCNVEVYAINYLTIYDDIEKLAEAAWLILQGEKRKNNINKSPLLCVEFRRVMRMFNESGHPTGST